MLSVRACVSECWANFFHFFFHGIFTQQKFRDSAMESCAIAWDCESWAMIDLAGPGKSSELNLVGGKSPNVSEKEDLQDWRSSSKPTLLGVKSAGVLEKQMREYEHASCVPGQAARFKDSGGSSCRTSQPSSRRDISQGKKARHDSSPRGSEPRMSGSARGEYRASSTRT